MFTIGDFARHGRVSVRMLRHYDATGQTSLASDTTAVLQGTPRLKAPGAVRPGRCRYVP